jgi:hypothetical protein
MSASSCRDVQSGIVHFSKANRRDAASLFFTFWTCGMYEKQQQKHESFLRRTG